jgi:endoglucanase
MNKVSRLLFLMLGFVLVISIVASSCAGDEPVPDPELTLSTETLSFSNAAETKFFHIKSNQDWKLISSESWLTFSAESGNKGTIKIDVSATANALIEQRTATITAKVGSLTKTLTVTQSASSLLVIEEDEFNVAVEGDEITIPVQSSGVYLITIDPEAEWITLASGGGTAEPKFTVISNPSMITREGTITFTLNGLTQAVTVSQTGNELTIPGDQTGMSDNAMTLAPKMGLGWNLGNTLEATSGPNTNGVYTASETLWGNPITTQTLMDGVKAAGFNTVRIPTAWSGYIVDQTTYKISDAWLMRVREVVDYCVNNDMYAIINIHWDGGWLENNPTYAAQVEVNKKQKALWEQIAVAFRNYDQHLLFAGTNEVHFDYGNPTAEHIEVQQSYLQTFVNAVRLTGGKNMYRNLIVQGYNTNIGHTDAHFTMPTDPTSNRLMAEVHFYDPFDFTLDATSTKYYWGAEFAGLGNTSTWGQEARVDSEFAIVKTKFIDNNIPVIMGEYGAMFRAALSGQTLINHIASRNHYLNYVTKKALENGIVPVYWDNGPMGNNSSGLFNRNTGAVADAVAVEAITSALD